MSKESTIKSVFAQLSAINVNGHTEKKPTGGNKELTYLSWPWAWAEVKKLYPNAEYSIYRDERNCPYIEDADFGLMCMTTVTINGQTHEMWLPVMDGANKAMRRQAYQYQVWDFKKNQYVTKTVQAATMFDINKTIMRCLVKNLAMFGLGLYIYAGEDLPEDPIQDAAPAPATPKPAKSTKAKAAPKQQDPQGILFDKEELENALLELLPDINGAKDIETLQKIHSQVPGLHNYAPYKDAMNKRYKEVQK